MKKLNLSPQESIDENKDVWCYEVGTDYENYSIASAEEFITYIKKQPVADVGAGDGAATKVFVQNGNPTTAVDINSQKLDKVKGAKTVLGDFVSYFSKPVGNIFLHHSLEHYADPETVLTLIGKNLKRGCYCYIAVPKGDTPHSVHHVAFEGLEELYPPGLKIILSEERDEPWPQYVMIARQDA